jgi:hypothetical protein
MISRTVVFTCWLALSLAGNAKAIIIDDFSVGDVHLTGPSATVDSPLLDSSSVIGGARRVRVNQNAMDLSIAGGNLVAQRTEDWGYFTIMYGFNTPLEADFTENGHDRLRLAFNSEGSQDANGIMWVSINSPLPPAGNAPGPSLVSIRNGGVVEIPFSRYATDLSQVMTFAVAVVRMQGGFSLDFIETAGPPAPGDFNRDGAVDQSDLDEFPRTYGTQTLPENGYFTSDANLDGRVDGADFLEWQRAVSEINLGSTPVPEPGGICLCWTLGVAVAVRRWNTSRRLRHPLDDGGCTPSLPGPACIVADFETPAARRMCRETVSRCTSNRLAIARCDQPCACNESIA